MWPEYPRVPWRGCGYPGDRPESRPLLPGSKGFLGSSTIFPGPGSADAGGLHPAVDVEANQDQGSSHTWALRVKLGLLGTLLGLTWRSRVLGQLGQGGAGREASKLSSSEKKAPRVQQTRSRAPGGGVPGGQR